MYTMEQPQYFSYQFTALNTAVATASYQATANGDLNGDGAFSTFAVHGSVQGGTLTTSPTIVETNPEE
jgi:hypothetical protein